MPRMPMTDILHRSMVTGLFGLTVAGVLMGVVIHRDTLARGREMLAQKEAETALLQPIEALNEAREQSLAEAAQAALRNPR